MTKSLILHGSFLVSTAMSSLPREGQRITIELIEFAAQQGEVFGRVSILYQAPPRLGVRQNEIGFCEGAKTRDTAAPTLSHFEASPDLLAVVCDGLAEEIGRTTWIPAENAQEATA